MRSKKRTLLGQRGGSAKTQKHVSLSPNPISDHDDRTIQNLVWLMSPGALFSGTTLNTVSGLRVDALWPMRTKGNGDK